MRARPAHCVGALLVLTRIVVVLAANVYVHLWDTRSYVEAARRSVPMMFADRYRAPLYPLLLKLVGLDERAMIVAQAALASISWLVLALAVGAWFSDRRLRWAAVASCYALSFATPVLYWDHVVYAESVSLSLFALTAAFVLRYARYRRAADLYGLILVAVPFALARDADVLACVVAGAVVGCLHPVGRRARWARVAALGLLLIALPALMAWSVAASGRGRPSTANAIFMWIAPEPALLGRMVSQYGMPDSVRACAGATVYDCGRDLADFHAWLAERGRSTYVRFLLANPGVTLATVWRGFWEAVAGLAEKPFVGLDRVRLLGAQEPRLRVEPVVGALGSAYWLGSGVASVSGRVTFAGLVAWLGPSRGRVVAVLPLVVVAVLLVVPGAIGERRLRLAPALFFAGVVLSQLVVIPLDALDIARHALLASIALNCLVLYLILLFADLLAVRPGRGA